jgi:hypothetical protein
MEENSMNARFEGSCRMNSPFYILHLRQHKEQTMIPTISTCNHTTTTRSKACTSIPKHGTCYHTIHNDITQDYEHAILQHHQK